MPGPIDIMSLGPDDGKPRPKPAGDTPPAAQPPPAAPPPDTTIQPPDPIATQQAAPIHQNQTRPKLPDEPPQWLVYLCAFNTFVIFWTILGWIIAAAIFVMVALPQFRAYKRAGRSWGDMPGRVRFLFAGPIITVVAGIPCYYWMHHLSLSQLHH